MNYLPVINHLAEGGTVVAAHRRLSRSLHHIYRHYRIKQGDSVWVTPVILPLDAWLVQLHTTLLGLRLIDVRLLDNEQVNQHWLKLLEETDEQLFLSPARTAASLAAAWRLRETYTPLAERSAGDPSQALEYSDQDTAFFNECAIAYEKRLGEHTAVDAAVLPNYLTDKLPQIFSTLSEATSSAHQGKGESPVAAAFDKLLLAGFADLTPSVQGLFKSIDEHFPIAVYDPLTPGSSQVAGLATLFSERRSGVELDSNDSQHRKPQAAQTRSCEFATPAAELRSVARWSREMLTSTSNGNMPSIVVVVADLQSRGPQVRRVFDEIFFPGLSPEEIQQIGRPYDVGIGHELSDWPLVRSALLSLRLALAQSEQFALSNNDLSELLLSHYCLNLPTDASRLVIEAERKKRMAFDQSLRGENRRTLLLSELLERDNLPEQFKRSLSRIKPPQYPKATASAWCNYFGNLLSFFGWPGDGLGSAEYQAFQAWQDVLESYARAGEVIGAHDAQSALTLLQRLLRQRKFQPETNELPIQITDRKESMGLLADHIWITGMDNQNWPGAVSPDAWLSRRWQQRAGVPGSCAQQVAEDALKFWKGWRASAASSVIASFAYERDNQQVMPASLLLDLPEFSFEPGKQDDEIARLNQSLYESLSLEEIVDCNGPGIEDGAEVRGGARIFEDQAQCPFRAFARHRLMGKSLEEANHGIDPRQKGNLLHLAMEVFWNQVGSHSALRALIDAESLQQTVEQCVDTAFEQEAEKRGLHHPAELLQLEKNRLAGIMLLWLKEVEDIRDEFTVVALEQNRQAEIEGMTFQLQVDRIDELSGGQKAIIDYKTGANNTSSGWLRERLQNPQLPLYATVEDDVEVLAFAQTTRNELTFKGLAADDNLLRPLKFKPNQQTDAIPKAESWQDLVAFWRDSTSALAREIKAGRASVDPQPGACRYCEFKSLCRIDPLRHAKFERDLDGSPEAYAAGPGELE